MCLDGIVAFFFFFFTLIGISTIPKFVLREMDNEVKNQQHNCINCPIELKKLT